LMCLNCERLERRIRELEFENSRLRVENAELKRRLAFYENAHVAPSQRRFPAKRSQALGGPRYPGRPRGYVGKTRPKMKPDVVKAPGLKGRCERCGAPLGEPCYVNHRIVEEVSNPSPRQVIDFLEFEWKCEACGSRMTARHPECPPEGLFGKNVYVQTTLLKYEDRLPLRKVQAALERQGLTVTPSTVLEILRRAAMWLRPEYEGVLQRIRATDVVYTDETGLKVDGGQYWIWTFTTKAETLFAVRKSRGKKVLKEILGEEFKGVIVCDGWRSYPNFTSRIQRCWSHLLREAEYLAERIDEAETLSQALHELYQRINIPPEDRPPPDDMENLVEEAKNILERWARRPYKTRDVRRFAGKIQNGIDHWFTFLTKPGVEPTNNRAERALREHVIQRKIIGTLRNQKGTFIHETITTVLATWKQQGLNPSKILPTTISHKWQNS